MFTLSIQWPAETHSLTLTVTLQILRAGVCLGICVNWLLLALGSLLQAAWSCSLRHRVSEAQGPCCLCQFTEVGRCFGIFKELT